MILKLTSVFCVMNELNKLVDKSKEMNMENLLFPEDCLGVHRSGRLKLDPKCFISDINSLGILPCLSLVK